MYSAAMRLCAILVGLALLAAPASAQAPGDIQLPANKPYRHKATKLTLPVAMDGLPRIRVAAWVPEIDEAVNFESADGREAITIFIFRNVTGAIPVWYDRTAWVIAHRDIYGGATPVVPAAAFVPPRQRNASALIGSYRPGKGPFKSTGAAYIPLGPEWYVSVRYSSSSLDPEALDTHLRSVIAAIDWPNNIEPQPDAAPLSDCAQPLATKGDAKPVTGDKAGAAALFGGLMASAARDDKKKMDAIDPPVIWCRDTGSYAGLEAHGVYRPVNTTDRYLIAFQDAGRGLWVGPDELAALLDKDAAPSWSVSVIGIGDTTQYVSRDRLPSPSQALDISNKESFTSKATTWGKKRNVTVGPGMLK